MAHDRERRMLLAGIGAASALAIARTARAATCTDTGPLAPLGPTMQGVFDKIALTDDGLAEARRPLVSCPSSLTAQFSITDPGVYYLTGNVTGQAGVACVEVLTDNVEIEGDGFIFMGVPGTLECIRTPSPQQCIGLYDIGFSRWQHTAVNLGNSSYCYGEELWFHLCDASSNPLGQGCCSMGPGGTLDDVSVLACTHGMLAIDRDGVFEECMVIDSTGGGLYSPGPCTMEDNFVLNNDAVGITVGSGGGGVMNNRICRCPTGFYVQSSVGARSSSVSENDVTECATGMLIEASDVTVEENHVGRCAKAIIISGPATRVLVDGNHCPGSSSSAITLENTTTRCLVVRNVVVSASVIPYDLNGANSWGPLVNANGVGDLTGSGTAMDPTANYMC